MNRLMKTSDVSPEAAASPLPQVDITPKPAPGLRGPKGLSPRANFSRVNTGSPPAADAGADSQKSSPPMGASMLPKLAGFSLSEALMTTMAVRPTLQQMVKQAMTDGVRRASISSEASRQMGNLGEKTAAEKCSKCGKEKCVCGDKTASLSTEYATKFASALEYGLMELSKQANKIEPGKGPGALAVSQSTLEGAINENMGQATPKNIVPMSTPLQSAHGESPTQMSNDSDRAPGGSKKASAPLDLIAAMAKQATDDKKDEGGKDKEKDSNFPGLANLKGIVASVPRPGAAAIKAPVSVPRPTPKLGSAPTPDNLVDYLLAQTKEAEDAINPAHISAGKAVPPETSASGEPGGAPAGGKPQGPTGLVGSNAAAIAYTRGQAYANRKADMAKHITEPMMSAEHDKALANAFSHTGQAGTKISSAAPDDLLKVAAGRALLTKLTEEVSVAQATSNASAPGA